MWDLCTAREVDQAAANGTSHIISNTSIEGLIKTLDAHLTIIKRQSSGSDPCYRDAPIDRHGLLGPRV